MGLDELVNILDNDEFNIFRKEFPEKWQYLNTKIATHMNTLIKLMIRKDLLLI